MMDKMLNIMKMQAYAAQGPVSHPRVGTITAYDPNNHAVKVAYQPEGTESGWLPMMSQWVGNGWGMIAAPSIGDMVNVSFMDGNFETGMVTGRAYNDSDRPPAAPSGEFWLVHQSGSLLKFLNDGTVSMQASTLNLTGNLNIIDGNITCPDGDISDKKSSMQDMRDDYNIHEHGGPPPPLPQME
jgi:phage baseplate assembly protein gpV